MSFGVTMGHIITYRYAMCLLGVVQDTEAGIKMAANLQTTFLNSLTLMKSTVFWFKLLWRLFNPTTQPMFRRRRGECHKNLPLTNENVNIGSGNGLLPDGTKPLPEPMVTQISVAM